ncbi:MULTISPECIES: histone family protein [Halobacterium]|uniref:histone family protein n=1 Tax=Halobacterium TaxID=2239 RepID=UPI001965071A|nr:MULTISPECIES: histone family protein [Halobacterium]MCF2166065.1 histone family protein [Halobacterium salinarum]MCF2166841.1 histone family protein [Halobacterium salinarum]MCF2237753.1 histone family protein [Halobacterium salinarum]MDL0120262.1 NFYB/HAP3 family transcription factor subunit [Halobacterium salinarum]MDL0130849.1 NFYB/HAP3 family transcription factor subunit [Halobacterium salinarum]
MSVELPFAPVDSLIRGHAGDLRVSAGAAEELARRIQRHGAILAVDAAAAAREDGRKTLMASDFEGVVRPRDDTAPDRRGDLALPVAPVDRIARLEIDDRFRVSEDARVALAGVLEAYAADIADGAAVLAEHAGRRTVQAEDIQTYVTLVE